MVSCVQWLYSVAIIRRTGDLGVSRLSVPSMKQEKSQPILGYDIDKPRITAAGWLLILVYLGVPAMLIGGLIDFMIQLATGRCLGVWCLF